MNHRSCVNITYYIANSHFPDALVEAYLTYKHLQADDSAPSDSLSPSQPPAPFIPESQSVSDDSPHPVPPPSTLFSLTAVHERCKLFKAKDSLFYSNSFQAREIIIVEQKHDESVNQALLRLGLLGVSPVQPTIAISLKVLELYYYQRRRHPRLGILPFVRALCDLQKVSLHFSAL